MVKIFKHITRQSGRLYLRYGLLFLLSGILTACKHSAGNIAPVYKDGRAVAIQIPQNLLHDVSQKEVKRSVTVTLSKPGIHPNIFGDITVADEMVVFTPLIPLSPETDYNILQDGRLIGAVTIPAVNGVAPKLTATYPAADSIPENTLKLYFEFSHPMRTGQALEHICLLDHNLDTMRNVFLNLQPELWDVTGKVLTLWLDPGRIKRGLVLNRELGNPLKKAECYQIIVSAAWKDTRGIKLSQKYTRRLFVGERSAETIDINTWQMSSPKALTKQALLIDTRRPLDHYLLQESITVKDAAGKEVSGVIALSKYNKQWKFTPAQTWQAQNYKIRVDARLEDLAGNNLNRVFDRDITKDKQQNREYFERTVQIK